MPISGTMLLSSYLIAPHFLDVLENGMYNMLAFCHCTKDEFKSSPDYSVPGSVKQYLHHGPVREDRRRHPRVDVPNVDERGHMLS